MPGGRPKGDPNHQRKGNGAGWGGAARRSGGDIVPGTPGPGRGITGKSVAELMALQAAREIAADAWLAILKDPAHPRHADMIAKAADRMDGAPKQTLDVRERNPDEMTDAELAAIAARGRRPITGATDAED